MLANPLVTSNPANLWRVSKILAEAKGVRDLETIVTKPKEADIYSPQEFLQRVISGQFDLQIRPGIDSDSYVFEIQLYMRTESFQSLDPKAQKTLADALRRAYMMSVAEKQALMDVQQIKAGMNQQAQADQAGISQPDQEQLPAQEVA